MNELTNNHAGSKEVSETNTNPIERGINMETVNDQQAENNNQEKESTMTSTPKTRIPYDGSKAHGVSADLEHIKTITAYDNAVDRLRQRRAFLINEYKQIATDYEATPDVSERARLLKSKVSKEAQIKAVSKKSKSLSSIKSEIEDAEREAQAAVEFIDYDAA
jgi:hypothetical protein